ncbi:BZ3500_MvSof-1268-A1-R1_Chr2-1g04473 [Microbotryum saponariae]|uniref:BZ3500_MvSof-1268-A1-R1_Chr2-1g04473 protein n=1 Tax=Microbotryum saponariae TaxID=289078 RepID=A0A2X0KFB3_9BASI|nr:BZ3500_MvSof-1268-A1-R1_Chr2-1g04473 [Microbotryum saponariae]SCZ91789.1 BZ3501_MvSof-1269-A2-R1_Chr2-1g04129 [Microbotryum saponariae]
MHDTLSLCLPTTPVAIRALLIGAVVAVCTLATCGSALPAHDIQKKDVVIMSTGTRMTSGKISDKLGYQSSGVLIHGGCGRHIAISDCWQMGLNATGNLATRSENGSSVVHSYDPSDPKWEEDVTGQTLEKRQASARQRIKIFSLPPAPAKSRNLYIWRSYLTNAPSTIIGTNFFHLFQLLRRDSTGGAVLTGDVKGNSYVLMDNVRKQEVTIPLGSFQGRVIEHRLWVVAGTNGSLSYVATDLDHGKRLMTYAATGDTGTNSSIKFGLYRTLPVPGPASGYYGDYQGEFLSNLRLHSTLLIA